jgi:hypothetical protein
VQPYIFLLSSIHLSLNLACQVILLSSMRLGLFGFYLDAKSSLGVKLGDDKA